MRLIVWFVPARPCAASAERRPCSPGIVPPGRSRTPAGSVSENRPPAQWQQTQPADHAAGILAHALEIAVAARAGLADDRTALRTQPLGQGEHLLAAPTAESEVAEPRPFGGAARRDVAAAHQLQPAAVVEAKEVGFEYFRRIDVFFAARAAGVADIKRAELLQTVRPKGDAVQAPRVVRFGRSVNYACLQSPSVWCMRFSFVSR